MYKDIKMKEFIKLVSFIRKHKGKIAVLTIFIVLILGSIGFYKTLKEKSILISVFKSITLLALNVPEEVNPYTGIAYFLAVVLVYAGFFLLAFNNLLNNMLFKLFLKDKNIVLFGFGEINKNFLENFRKNRRNENVIVVDKEDKNFDEFWEEGYVFLKKEVDDELIKKFNFEKTTDIIVALGNNRVNIDVALKLIDKLKDVKTETKLIVHISDRDISDLFFEKLEKVKKEKNDIKINLKTFSLNTEIVDDLFDKYATKFVPYEYAKLNSNKKELKLAIIGNSNVNLEVIKRIFVNFIFPNQVKTKIFLIDENDDLFYKRVEFETNYTLNKFPHIILERIKLDFDLLKNRDFWLQEDLINIIIAFEDEDKNLKTVIDLFEKVFIHEDKEKLIYPNVFFAMYDELAFSDYIDNNKDNFKNFFTFGSLKEILNVKNLLDDEKFEIAMNIHNAWANNKDIKKAWYSSILTDRLSSIAQYEHIPFKLLSLGFEICKKENCKDETKEYEKLIKSFEKENISFEEFLSSGVYYLLCNTEHRRWMAYHFLNNWEYDDYEDKEEKNYKKRLKLHNCLIDFDRFKYNSIKNTFIYDFLAYKNIPKYLNGKYKIKKII